MSTFDQLLTQGFTYVCTAQVPVQRGTIKLREDKNFSNATIEAITNWDVNEAKVRPKRHSRLGTVFG